ncbi:hypothetical protein LIER_32545 [Lithospermum erythrorhizon]|uniref:Uncharacterized protein n=1 Tax=Lithospermum erythrorhizon TaxID=34254 RepID=A0AAV3RVH1_LITER
MDSMDLDASDGDTDSLLDYSCTSFKDFQLIKDYFLTKGLKKTRVNFWYWEAAGMIERMRLKSVVEMLRTSGRRKVEDESLKDTEPGMKRCRLQTKRINYNDREVEAVHKEELQLIIDKPVATGIE